MSAIRTEPEWVALIGDLIEQGQCFLAYDLSAEARLAYPGSQKIRLLAIYALLRSGAVSEARKLLSELETALETQESLAARITESLHRHLPALLAPDLPTQAIGTTPWVTELAEHIVRLGGQARRQDTDDRETLRLAAQVHGESWRQQGRPGDLRQSRDAHLRAFRQFQDSESGIHAAHQSWLLGERELAGRIAAEAKPFCNQGRAGITPKEQFFCAIDQAEAILLTGDPAQALEGYRQAKRRFNPHYAWVVEARERLGQLQRQGFPEVDEILALLSPPVIVIGAGQALDAATNGEQVFPPALEKVVERAIQERLDELGAHIGYSSAGAGTELLFVEALIEREAEVHLVLPCAAEDFVRERVAYAGQSWVRRFRQALKLASSVTYATEEAYLGHDWLFRFNNQIIDGLARLRAELLGTQPYLLLVWDYAAENAAGTAADFMDHWPDIARLRLIELDELRAGHADLGEAAPLPGPQALVPGIRREPQRVPKTMLFADIVGFSKLHEEDLPGLWRYLEAIKARLDRGGDPPDLVESWGDALYVVMPSARAILRYAFCLQDSFATLDPAAFGVPQSLSLRIGLHAGPVYTGRHPLTNRPIVYGSHVSRTARIEPVTVPGHVYASQQFVALLTAEETAYRAEQGRQQPWYACEYLGVLQLAKQYGDWPVYHLLPRTEAT